MTAMIETRYVAPVRSVRATPTTYRATFERWLRAGMNELAPEEQRMLMAVAATHREETRAMSSNNDTLGGFLIPDELMRRAESAITAASALRNVATIITTSGGGTLPIATDDDTANAAEPIGENTVMTDLDLSVGQRALRAYTYRTGVIRVSLALLQDAAFPLENYLADRMGARLGRGQNRDCTNGAGPNRATGIVSMATPALTAASATAVTGDELLNLEHAVPEAYRARGRWMMNSTTLRGVKGLKDGDGRYLFSTGTNGRDYLDGREVIVNVDMPDMASGARSILFGDFSRYFIREVGGLQLLRVVERYAELGEVGFIGYGRFDGALIDAGQHPAQCLVMA